MREILFKGNIYDNGDIYLHIVDVCGVRRSNGLAEYLVD